MSRIYVACLAAYNSGKLHGRWIDADQSAEDIGAEVAEMLRESPCPNVTVDCPDCEGDSKGCDTCNGAGKVPSAEEWAIHDYEFEGVKISEHESFKTVSRLAELVEEHGEAFAAWWNNCDRDIDTAEDGFLECYAGTARTLADWAEDFGDETGMLDDVPGHLSRYFDWESYARDLECGGDVWTESGGDGVLVFWNR